MTPEQRFRERFRLFSLIGGTGDGGVDRVEGTPANGEARQQLVRWIEELGLELKVDAIGNIFGVATLAGPDAPLILVGSHIDSQPKGGRFDGAYGVIAALEAVAAIRDELAVSGDQARCNLAVVAWAGEEGARFSTFLGSRVYTGARSLAETLAGTDSAGISAADALGRIGALGTDRAPSPPAAYVELHVECGSQLEAQGCRLGVFRRWWGAHKVDVRFEGKTAHTGPTPMHERQDALLAAAQLVVAMRQLGDAAPSGDLHTSVAKLDIAPNSRNVVPDRATAFVEIRSAKPDVLKATYERLMGLIPFAAAAARCRWTVTRDDLREPGFFDERLGRVAYEEADRIGEPAVAVDTLPGHDAITLSALCPALMLVVPSRGGLCHHPDEWTDPDDLDLGFAWLTQTVKRLVTEPGHLRQS